MKDRLGRSEWINRPIKNPTQNMFRRFVKSPASMLDTGFSESKRKFDASRKSVMQTWISDLLEQ